MRTLLRLPSRAVPSLGHCTTGTHAHRSKRTRSASTMASDGPVYSGLRLDAFAERQWADNYAGTRLTCAPTDFMKRVDAHVTEQGGLQQCLVDGYAPFCKHVFMPNWMDDVRVPVLPITPDNEAQLRTTYAARTDKELPVLSRFFPLQAIGVDNLPKAAYLDLILYSKDQIIKENQAMGVDPVEAEYEWGIISIKAQMQGYETPMAPITMLRNALGKEEGGSGVPLDRQKYQESVAFWSAHAAVL